jgi:hypothetical protein
MDNTKAKKISHKKAQEGAKGREEICPQKAQRAQKKVEEKKRKHCSLFFPLFISVPSVLSVDKSS